MQVFLVNKTTGEYSELEGDCKIVLDLSEKKTIELDVGAQLCEGDTAVLTIIGGKPFAKLSGKQLTLGIKEPGQ